MRKLIEGNCTECGKTIIKYSRNHRFCKECSKKRENERQRIRGARAYHVNIALDGDGFKKKRNKYQSQRRKLYPDKFNFTMAKCYFRKLTEEQRKKLIEEFKINN